VQLDGCAAGCSRPQELIRLVIVADGLDAYMFHSKHYALCGDDGGSFQRLSEYAIKWSPSKQSNFVQCDCRGIVTIELWEGIGFIRAAT
jgi:hypothetical protein